MVNDMKTNSEILSEFSKRTGIRDGVVEAIVSGMDAAPRFIGFSSAGEPVCTTTSWTGDTPKVTFASMKNDFRMKPDGEYAGKTLDEILED